MSNVPNKKRIGLFLLVGFICLFGLIGKFVVGKIMPQKDELVVMFFHESVKGLNVGSPVVLEGVEVGKVVRVSLVADLDNRSFRIPVYMRFSNNLNMGKRIFDTPQQRRTVLNEMISQGIRARLVNQNLLTGQLMIELVLMPETPAKYVSLPETDNLPQIPTALSKIGELSKGIQDLPLRDIVHKLDQILDTVSADIPGILPKYEELGTNLNQSVTALNQLIAKMEKSVPQTTFKTTQTLNNFNKTLDTVGQAAKSLRNLADYLERHPESLLKGKGK